HVRPSESAGRRRASGPMALGFDAMLGVWGQREGSGDAGGGRQTGCCESDMEAGANGPKTGLAGVALERKRDLPPRRREHGVERMNGIEAAANNSRWSRAGRCA